MVYYLYVHTVPNGKIYVGVCKNPLKRWNYGNGYIKNQSFFKDIMKYGWNNIKHEIISTYYDKETASIYERIFITLLDSENPNIGYNKTQYKNSFMQEYGYRVEYENPEKYVPLERSHRIYDEIYRGGEILSCKEYKNGRKTIRKYIIKYENATYKITEDNHGWKELYRLTRKAVANA